MIHITALVENTSCRTDIGCEHGLSLWVETPTHRFLFDAGQSDLFARNAGTLGIDLSRAEFAILSHGHYDHGGGMQHFLAVNAHAPLYLHTHAFEGHYNAVGKDIGLDPSLRNSDRLVFTGDRTDIDGELTLLTGNAVIPPSAIESYGLTMSGGLPEDFRHEQVLLIREGGRKILLGGCAHKGILRLMDWLRPDVVVGGFHFKALDPRGDGRPALEEAAERLLDYPAIYYTCHCTGQDQFDFLRARMGDRLRYLAGGQTITI